MPGSLCLRTGQPPSSHFPCPSGRQSVAPSCARDVEGRRRPCYRLFRFFHPPLCPAGPLHGPTLGCFNFWLADGTPPPTVDRPPRSGKLGRRLHLKATPVPPMALCGPSAKVKIFSPSLSPSPAGGRRRSWCEPAETNRRAERALTPHTPPGAERLCALGGCLARVTLRRSRSVVTIENPGEPPHKRNDRIAQSPPHYDFLSLASWLQYLGARGPIAGRDSPVVEPEVYYSTAVCIPRTGCQVNSGRLIRVPSPSPLPSVVARVFRVGKAEEFSPSRPLISGNRDAQHGSYWCVAHVVPRLLVEQMTRSKDAHQARGSEAADQGSR